MTTEVPLTEREEKLLAALAWLLRVSQGSAYDDDDLYGAHKNAEQLIDQYTPEKDDDE